MEHIDNLSALTTISKENLTKFSKYNNAIHSHDLFVGMQNGDVVELPILEGSIFIKINEENLEYKFIPSDKFEKILRETVLEHKDFLVDKLSSRVIYAFENTYKDVF